MANFKKRRPFTLLELMVCLMLMAMITALLGIKVYDFIGDHRFRSSVEDLFTDIRQLQVLAVSHDCDMEVRMFRKNESFYYECFTEAPLKKTGLFQKHSLKGVISLTCGDRPVSAYTLRVYSSGRIEPQELLGFHPKPSKDSSFSLWLNLTRPLLLTMGEKPLLKIEEVLPPMPQ